MIGIVRVDFTNTNRLYYDSKTVFLDVYRIIYYGEICNSKEQLLQSTVR